MTTPTVSSPIVLALNQLPRNLSIEDRLQWEAIYNSIALLQGLISDSFGVGAVSSGGDQLAQYFSVGLLCAEDIPQRSFVRITPSGLRLANWGSLVGYTQQGAAAGEEAVVILTGTIKNEDWNLVPGTDYVVNDSAGLWSSAQVPNLFTNRAVWFDADFVRATCYSYAGVAKSSTELIFNPYGAGFEDIITG